MRRFKILVLLGCLLGHAVPLHAQSCNANMPESTPTADFTDHGNGTVTHIRTGLMWKRCAEGQAWNTGTCTGAASGLTWSGALLASRNANTASYTDWRLPNVKELKSIVEDKCASPSINVGIFPNTPTSSFWSASTDAGNSISARFVQFNNGASDFVSNKLGALLQVRLVRAGQSYGAFDAADTVPLTVAKTGAGSVSGAQAPINCGSTCSANLGRGFPITLTASPAANLTAWGGACASALAAPTCTLTMDAAKSVTASFINTPLVTSLPTSLTFAAQNIGSTSTAQSVTLNNSGTAALVLGSVSASGDFAVSHNCGSGLGAGGSCTLNTSFRPTASGPRSGSVNIVSNAPGSPHTITLSGTGRGTATFTVTNTNDSGAGSLRDAVAQANASPELNTVNFAATVTGTILLTTGSIQIKGPMTIVGPGADVLAINGNAQNRIFVVATAPPACPALDNGGVDYLVTISRLKLTNGLRGADGGGGAINAEHSLTLDDVIISNNIAGNGGGLYFAVQYPNQVLTINKAQFLNNIAKPLQVPATTGSNGGAVLFSDKCLASPTTLPAIEPVAMNISQSVFSGNRAQPVGLQARGGAIVTYSRGVITITDTRIVDNHIDVPNPPVTGKTYYGAGVYGTAKSVQILRSEISDNSVIDVTGSGLTLGGGMGFYNDDPSYQTPDTAMSVKIDNSTVSGNSVAATGGAMWVGGNVALELNNSTVTANTAANGRTGGILFTTFATTPASSANTATPSFAITSSILANNALTPTSATFDFAIGTSISGLTVNATRSLLGTLCSTCGVSGVRNLQGVDPLLGPLAFNGGSTRTHALLAGSLAINAGSNPQNWATDQRGAGYLRANGTTDMGAYEFLAPRLINLSTRGQVLSGDNVMIGGFIIQGSAPKNVLIRAVGPTLANFGVRGVLSDPALQLFSGQTQIAANDDWQTASNAAAIQATTLAPSDKLESAILTTLAPGAYTAIVSGVGGATGVGIVEVYDIDHPEVPLINISTRGQVQTGDNVMIGGFIIQGTSPQTVLIRAVGPNLANFGVSGVLSDPKLELYSGQNIIASNDNWQTATNAAAIQATTLAPADPREAAILITLQPGAYTAVVSEANGGVGVGIIEVFAR